LKLKNRLFHYLLLSIANLAIPFSLGAFLVFIFSQAPEFVIVGVFTGAIFVQAMFFKTVQKTRFFKSLLFASILFTVTLGVTILVKSIEPINVLTYTIFPLDTNSDKVLRFIVLYTSLCVILWELIHYLINRAAIKMGNATKSQHA
jgi:hypothetical protein